jgi:hypothetical protein
MATDLSTALKDYNLKLRTAGTAATSDETGTGKYVTKAKTTVRACIITTALNLTTGNIYNFKFQESAVLGSGYTDITGGTSIMVTATGRKFCTFQLSGDKPYVRHILDVTGGTASFDGDIFIADKDDI